MSTLAGGASGALVQRLQLGLRRAGEDPGPLDGEYGAATARAVAAFQRRQGLAADGQAGRDTQQALTPWYRGLRGGAADLVPCEIAWSAALTEDCVLGLAARHPLARLEVFGKSVLGRRLLRSAPGPGTAPGAIQRRHHANEWITVPVLLEFAQALARAWEEDGEIGGVSARALLERSTVYIAPLINPDGTDLVTGCLKEGPVLARARALAAPWTELPFPSGWKANLRGVDLNLQYPAGWEAARRRKAAAGFFPPGAPGLSRHRPSEPAGEPGPGASHPGAGPRRWCWRITRKARSSTGTGGATALRGAGPWAAVWRKKAAMPWRKRRRRPGTPDTRTGSSGSSAARAIPWNAAWGRTRCPFPSSLPSRRRTGESW